MKVTDTIHYIGVNDHSIDLFEGQYKVPNGMSYNSYIIEDDKIAVMDTVDTNFTIDWLNNIEKVLKDKEPNYLIIHHMEPDHSANIAIFMKKYVNTIIVSTAKAFSMMNQFFGDEFQNRRIIVKEGDVLELGKHTLTFILAPMVHWPEVMVSYDTFDKVLFSADAFGKFGAIDVEEPWDDEARRYYIGIIGKYGMQVQNLLKKTSKIDISIICSLHGPILKNNLSHYIRLYDIWSSYNVESKGVVVAYTSIYGNTRKAVNKLVQKLKENGEHNIVIYDLARCDMSKAIADAFRYEKLILATTTYNADIFPFMKDFINHLTERLFQNRIVAFMENGSWAPQANRVMKEMLSNCKNIKFAMNNVTIVSSLNSDSKDQITALAEELCAEYKA